MRPKRDFARRRTSNAPSTGETCLGGFIVQKGPESAAVSRRELPVGGIVPLFAARQLAPQARSVNPMPLSSPSSARSCAVSPFNTLMVVGELIRCGW